MFSSICSTKLNFDIFATEVGEAEISPPSKTESLPNTSAPLDSKACHSLEDDGPLNWTMTSISRVSDSSSMSSFDIFVSSAEV